MICSWIFSFLPTLRQQIAVIGIAPHWSVRSAYHDGRVTFQINKIPAYFGPCWDYLELQSEHGERGNCCELAASACADIPVIRCATGNAAKRTFDGSIAIAAMSDILPSQLWNIAM
jgi:hypothetical protein